MKSLLQQVQSRISKRRALICEAETIVQRHYVQKHFFGTSLLTPFNLSGTKAAIKAGAESQQLDKKIFANLLNQSRNKFEGYFRSSYKPAEKLLTSDETFAIVNAAVQGHLEGLGARLGVSLTGKPKVFN